jgi:hypothetical protein
LPAQQESGIMTAQLRMTAAIMASHFDLILSPAKIMIAMIAARHTIMPKKAIKLTLLYYFTTIIIGRQVTFS